MSHQIAKEEIGSQAARSANSHSIYRRQPGKAYALELTDVIINKSLKGIHAASTTVR